MSIPNLTVNILECRTYQPPRRKLELPCRVSNPLASDICILDAWVEVAMLNSIVLDEGRLFQPMYNRTNPAVISSKEVGHGAFHIELPANVLEQIEEQRAGGDLTLRFSSRVLVAELIGIDKASVLSAPFETSFGNVGTDRFEYLIPQSEWVKLLRNLQWSELELLELPASQLRGVPLLARALKRFQDAQDCYRRSDWEETMLNCRKAFEAIVQDATNNTDMKESGKVYSSLIGEGDKADRFDKLARALGDFLHLGRHENLPNVSIKRTDSELALYLTGALLRYLGQN